MVWSKVRESRLIVKLADAFPYLALTPPESTLGDFVTTVPDELSFTSSPGALALN